jgi:hypothetical protein
MSPEQENFEQLRRLLALKRHEQPPPGYFNNFSRQVISRIRAGERPERESFGARFFGEVPWLQQLWAALEAKPVLAGVFAVAVCGLLVSGAIYSERAEPTQAATPLALSPERLAAGGESLVNHLVPVGVVAVEQVSGMGGIPNWQKPHSLFEEMGEPQILKASFGN